jgi:ABC-2 type transport system permease protein
MKLALWKQTLADCRGMLACSCALMFCFHWLFVWLSSKIDLGALGMFLVQLPKEFQKISPIPMADIATPAGRVGLSYVDPVAIIAATAWGIARGSDAVSGPLGRGTLEMLLAQPVRRITVLFVQATVTTLGAVLIGLYSWTGTAVGLETVELRTEISPLRYVPAAANLAALAFFMAGITTMLSAFDRYRWRTIGIASGFYVVSLIFKLVARMANGWEQLIYASFLGAFEPLLFINDTENGWRLALEYNGVLVVLGVAAYLVAAIVFCKRDLPAPI